MLLLECTPQLELLHKATVNIFPLDLRHGETGGTFVLHMALVYAPESEGKCDMSDGQRKGRGLDHEMGRAQTSPALAF